MPSILAGSEGSCSPRKVGALRFILGHFVCEIEQKKLQKKLAPGSLFFLQDRLMLPLYMYIYARPEILKKIGPVCLQLFIFKGQRVYML